MRRASDTDWADRIRAERLMLGIMMLTPRAADHALTTDIVAVDDLSLRSHRVVYDAMKRLHATGQRVDVITVEYALRCRGLLTTAGGPRELDRLVADVPRVSDLGAAIAMMKQ